MIFQLPIEHVAIALQLRQLRLLRIDLLIERVHFFCRGSYFQFLLAQGVRCVAALLACLFLRIGNLADFHANLFELLFRLSFLRGVLRIGVLRVRR